MAETENPSPWWSHPMIRILLSVLSLAIAGYIFGFVGGRLESGKPFHSGIWLELGALGLLLSVLIGWQFRQFKAQHSASDAPTAREQKNKNVMIGVFAAGAVIGLILSIMGLSNIDFETGGGFAEGFKAGINAPLSDSPLPVLLVLTILFFWVVVTPILTWYWWKHAADEQEISAYKDGALWAGTFYLFAAPAWWLMYRGGMAPQVEGKLLFVAFTFIWCGVWLWKKYR